MVFSHVLISRPQPEAIELAGFLKDTGLEAILAPAFSFEPEFSGIEFGKAWPVKGRRAAIFTSPRAVEFGLRQLPAGFLDDVEIAAIGPATSNALESNGHTVTIIPESQFNSESLLAHRALVSDPGTAIIFAAPGGRQELFSGLQKLSWHVAFAHVYHALPLEPSTGLIDAISRSKKIISVWTSANALKYWAGKFEPSTWEKMCQGSFVVTSRRIAEVAKRYFTGQIIVTDGPSNICIRDCILNLNRNKL